VAFLRGGRRVSLAAAGKSCEPRFNSMFSATVELTKSIIVVGAGTACEAGDWGRLLRSEPDTRLSLGAERVVEFDAVVAGSAIKSSIPLSLE
jgi:hypothetical protein